MFAMSGDVVEKFTGDPRVAGVTPAADRHRRSGAPPLYIGPSRLLRWARLSVVRLVCYKAAFE